VTFGTMGAGGVLGAALIGAAASSVSYTATSQSKATLSGLLENAAIGAAAGAAGFGMGKVVTSIFGGYSGPFTTVIAGHAAAALSQVGIGYTQSYANAEVTHTQDNYNWFNAGVDVADGLIGF
jgi:hypothetical protein